MWQASEDFSTSVPGPWGGGIPIVPTPLPRSAQFVILGVMEGLVPLSKRKVTL